MQLETIKGDRLNVKFVRVAVNGVRGFICTLPDVPNEKNPIAGPAKGVSYCSPKDKWSAKKGKKLALARAMQEAGFAKLHRSYIWDAYLAQEKDEEV